MIVETLVIHGGDLIEWQTGSGFVDQPKRHISPSTLHITFSKTPRGLRIQHESKGTILWHSRSAGASKTVSGVATETDLVAAPESSFVIAGKVSDPSRQFLPRAFTLTIGNTTAHAIPLYSSPLGARFSKAGGILGKVTFDDGADAPWALLSLIVSIPSRPALEFTAQTDSHGEFRLPLDRLPSLGKNAPHSTYSAQLRVKASSASRPDEPIDPGTLLPVKIAKGKTASGRSRFADALSLDVTPGVIGKVVSPKHDSIVLKST